MKTFKSIPPPADPRYPEANKVFRSILTPRTKGLRNKCLDLTAEESCDEYHSLCVKLETQNAALVRVLEKVERANSIQHSGGKLLPEDWSELYQLANEARSSLQS